VAGLLEEEGGGVVVVIGVDLTAEVR
jgi:hypothetical protein